jgi:hypothetical protein
MLCKEDLSLLRKEVRIVLVEVKSTHGKRAIISAFTALPVLTAVEAGRAWIPKADLPLGIYDQQPSPHGVAPTLMIQGGS